MKFIDKIEDLQKENEGSIVIIKNGIFFIGIGKDAIILHDILGLKLTCMKPKLCKVRIFSKKYREIYSNFIKRRKIICYLYKK